MRKPQMLTVLFYLRLNKSDKTKLATIYCRVSLGGTRGVPFSTNIQVLPHKWKNQKTDDFDKNARINRIRNGIETLKDQFDISGEPFTVFDLVDTYLGKRDYNATFLNVYHEYIQDKRDSGRAESTLTVIENYRNICEKFINQSSRGLLIKQVDTDTFQAFKRWLKSEGYAKNTMAKHLIYFKSVVDFGVILKLIKYNPIKAIRIEKEKPKDPVFLTIDELQRIATADFRAIPAAVPIADRLDRVRDILMILRATGVHWGDYLKINDQNLFVDEDGDLVYTASRQKTDNVAYTILEDPYAKAVVQKYGGASGLPRMSNQKFNDYIKMVFALLNIHKYGSAKIGRKSLADYHTNEAIKPDGVIMKMMGLGDARSLDHYRRVDKRAIKKLIKESQAWE